MGILVVNLRHSRGEWHCVCKFTTFHRSDGQSAPWGVPFSLQNNLQRWIQADPRQMSLCIWILDGHFLCELWADGITHEKSLHFIGGMCTAYLNLEHAIGPIGIDCMNFEKLFKANGNVVHESDIFYREDGHFFCRGITLSRAHWHFVW